MDRAQLSKEQLIAFSGQHLYYEITMFFGVKNLLKKDIEDFYVYSALLESMIIHGSVILDFFYKPPQKEDDASALDYIDDIARWKKLRPSYDKYFRKFHRRRSREVVHLSYKRMEVKDDERLWNMKKLTPHIKELVRVFMDVANPQLIHPKFYELKELIEEPQAHG